MNGESLIINKTLVQRLVGAQFPHWKDLPVRPVAESGWDNRTFHLGDEMLVRLPSAQAYAAQADKEQRWLPKLAPLLPLQIPEPLAIGNPEFEYPWKWSIYRWLQGKTLSSSQKPDLNHIANQLAEFLIALHKVDTTDGPLAGPHSFYRGGSLRIYDAETKQAIALLKDKVDVKVATEIWEAALESHWKESPVWIHGDISAGNLLLKEGRLNAVIDFGQLAVGDPACDLAIGWTLFEGKSRECFREKLPLDGDTWARGRAWTLWKTLIYLTSSHTTLNFESEKSWHILNEVIEDHRSQAKI